MVKGLLESASETLLKSSEVTMNASPDLEKKW